VEDRQQRLREIQQQLKRNSRSNWTTLLRQQAEKRSRLNVLEQLQSEHEGFGAGALRPQNAGNVLGSLADKIRVPDQYVVAIETALGHHLQLVLTEQPETARQIRRGPARQQIRPRQRRRAALRGARRARLRRQPPRRA
jgi:chromosome segregation protein